VLWTDASSSAVMGLSQGPGVYRYEIFNGHVAILQHHAL
jgi:hypothetical protein